MPIGVAACTRSAICRLRFELLAVLISAEVARQVMHQQYLGPPFDSKSRSKSDHVLRVTSRMVSEAELVLVMTPNVKHLRRRTPSATLLGYGPNSRSILSIANRTNSGARKRPARACPTLPV